MCPRCKNCRSNEIEFNLTGPKIRLRARVCKVCGYIWADDDEYIDVVRKHLKWIKDVYRSR